MKIKNFIKCIFAILLLIQSSAAGELIMPTENTSEFNLQDFLAAFDKLESDEAKDNYVKNFVEMHKGNFPLLENDSTVVFFYYGKQDSAGVIGDMTSWAEPKLMTRVGKTDLYYLKDSYEKNARIEYWLTYGKNSFPSIDSLNQYLVLNGFGPISELAMPEYERHEYFNEYIHGEKGDGKDLKHHNIPSKFLNYDHDVHVYLPPGCTEDIKYPVIYLNDGYDYVEFAATPYVLDRMIKENKIDPVIAVFVTPPNRFEPKFPNRMTEYGMNDDYVKFLADELVPFIDNNYSTKRDAQDRIIAGSSYGGLISFYVSFSRPEVFGKAYSQSGYHSFRKNEMIKLVRENDVKDIKAYVDVGTYETIVGANLLPADELNFTRGNRDLKAALTDKGYDFIYKEYPEGHTWGNWRRHLIDALIYFYGK